jgi:hypothetical protein
MNRFQLSHWNNAIIMMQSFQMHIYDKYFDEGFAIGAFPPVCDDSQYASRTVGSPLGLFDQMTL